MSVSEIYFRVIGNIAGERWADGALAPPFEAGVLTSALERIIDGVSELNVKPSSV